LIRFGNKLHLDSTPYLQWNFLTDRLYLHCKNNNIFFAISVNCVCISVFEYIIKQNIILMLYITFATE